MTNLINRVPTTDQTVKISIRKKFFRKIVIDNPDEFLVVDKAIQLKQKEL